MHRWPASCAITVRRAAFGLALAGLLITAPGTTTRAAAELDPKAISIQLPADIKWVKGRGSESATLVGDPSKPGLYVVLQKWLAHNNSRPHFHPNDRYITVLSGTWWVNTGDKYDPDGMKPVPAGSFVTHFAKQVHYDGAKDVECILQIVGMGPATSTPVAQ
jgi:quercetin dioxygenase-like cupin family protein